MRGGGGEVAAYPAVVDISCSLLSPCLGRFLSLGLRRLDTVRRHGTSSGSFGGGRRDRANCFLAGGLARASSDIGKAAGAVARHLRRRGRVDKQQPTGGKRGGDVVGGRRRIWGGG